MDTELEVADIIRENSDGDFDFVRLGIIVPDSTWDALMSVPEMINTTEWQTGKMSTVDIYLTIERFVPWFMANRTIVDDPFEGLDFIDAL